MITAQLGPPPAVPGRASTAGGTAGDEAPGTSTSTEDGAFVALLLGVGPSADGAEATAPPPPPAAGPLTGELPTATDADAAGPTPPPAPAAGTSVTNGVAPAPPGATAAAIAATISAAPSGDAITAVQVATAIRSDRAAAPTSPATPSAVPAASVEPMPTGTPRQAGAPVAPGASGSAAASPVHTPEGAPAVATVTVRLSRQEAPAAARPASAPASASAPAVAPPPAATAPVAAPAHGAEVSAAPVPPPVQVTAPAPAPTVGHIGLPTGVTSAAELAHELGARMRMAVREGGRELVVNLRPPELGHLTVRVTMIDGALTAHITADRPDAARLLQQSLPQLGAVLGDLGYNLDGLDVTYGGQDPRDAPGSSAGGDGAGATPHGGAAGDTTATPVPSTAASVTDGDRLDLLA